VALRINPDIDARTHSYITTGKSENKFGLDLKTAASVFKKAGNFKNVAINGIHLHIGSQITDPGPFVKAVKKTVGFVNKEGIEIEYLNIGGGLGIVYSSERPQTAREFAGNLLPILKKTRLKVILEPGRFIAGNSGILVTEVVYIKKTARRTFIIADAGMNDLIRPSLYGGYHEIIPVRKEKTKTTKRAKYDVVGPICESGDFLAKDRKLAPVEEKDLLAVMSAGAYGFVMSSNYNSRPRAAEVLVMKGRIHVIRKRETLKDLVRGEAVPGDLR
jgi:diaminopimelate decarboxylase